MTVHTTLTLDPRVHHYKYYGRDRTARIEPKSFRCQQLAAALADAWLAVAPELPGDFPAIRRSVISLIKYLDTALDRPSSLETLTRAQVDAWEIHLFDIQQQTRSNGPYVDVISVLALLRRIEEDRPGRLTRDVVERSKQGTRLFLIRGRKIPAFSHEEQVGLVEAAGAMVRHALADLRADPARFRGPSNALMGALHVLIGACTGEPPEVLRRLAMADLEMTERTRRDGGPVSGFKLVSLGVDYVKERASAEYTVVYTSRHKDALAAYAALLELTAPLREETELDSVWLMRDKQGRTVQCSWGGLANLTQWAEKHAPNLALTEPVRYDRFRKVVTAEEALENSARYLRTGRHHTAETAFRYYVATPVLRAEAGRVLMDAISDMFDAALGEPTIVTTGAEQLIGAGVGASGLDAATGAAAVAGALDTPFAACKDITNSPVAPAGVVCPSSTDGTCYTCGNALIMRHHLPAVLAMLDLIEPRKAARLEDWMADWRDVYEYLTQRVIPSFSAEEVEAARGLIDRVPIDLGILNSARGSAV